MADAAFKDDAVPHGASAQSSSINLNMEVSEGESLDSQVFKAAVEAGRNRYFTTPQRPSAAASSAVSSHEIAQNMLKNKSKEDSTRVLADQIESLRDMERQNEYLTS